MIYSQKKIFLDPIYNFTHNIYTPSIHQGKIMSYIKTKELNNLGSYEIYQEVDSNTMVYDSLSWNVEIQRSNVLEQSSN